MSWPWNQDQRSLKVIESGTILSIGCGFLLVFYRNTVHKTHGIWDIRLQKCRDLVNWVRGPSRSWEMSPCNTSHMTFYWRSIAAMALSHVVSEIFNVEKCRDLEIGVNGHSRSLRVVSFDRLHDFLLVFFSNFVPKMHRFWDIWLQKCHDLENQVRVHQGHWQCYRSIERVWSSYWCSIVTMALSCVVSEIFNVKKMSWPWNPGHRSLKVIESGIIR